MSDSKDTAGNPKDRLAATSGRLDITLFPVTAAIYGALGMTEGDAKYGGFNYRVKGVRAMTYVAACLRHLFKWVSGEWEDPKTRVPHLASALACIAILIDSHECKRLIDDRPPRAGSDVPGLLTRFEDNVRYLYATFTGSPGRYTEAEHGAPTGKESRGVLAKRRAR